MTPPAPGAAPPAAPPSPQPGLSPAPLAGLDAPPYTPPAAPAAAPAQDADAGPARPADATTRLSRTLALVSVVGLILLGLAWELWLAPTGSGTLALKVVPLLPLLAGLWRYRMFSYRVLSLLVWLYFTEGVVRAVSDSGMSAWLAIGEVVLTLVAFAACALHVRWRLRKGRPS